MEANKEANMANEALYWLTPSQAARVLGVTPQMVRYYCLGGKLEFQATPLGRLINPDSVARLAKEREENKPLSVLTYREELARTG